MAEPVVLPAFLAEAMFLKLHLLMDIFHAMDVNQDGVLSAEEFIAGMKKRNLTEAQAQLVVLGSHKGTYIDGYIGQTFQITYDPVNTPLARFVRAYEDLGPAKALAYLKGVASVCALSARSVVTTEAGTIIPAVWSGGTMPKSRPATAAALGRLKHSEYRKWPLTMPKKN